MHTDYQAVARQLEWLAEALPDTDKSQDLKALARNVRLLGVMAYVLCEARCQRQLQDLTRQTMVLPDPDLPAITSPMPVHPGT